MTTIEKERQGLTIRPLAVEEVSLCVPFGQAFHAEMKLDGSFIPEVFIKNWTQRLSPGFPFPADILALRSGDELIGGIGLVVVPDELDARPIAQEFFIFISPEHRSGTGFLRLLRAFKEWSYEKQAVDGRLVHLLTLGETPSTVKLDNVYRKLGGKATEVGYTFPIGLPIEIWED